MSDEPDWDPVDLSVREQLFREPYKDLIRQWRKASNRVLEDHDGAITAAKTLMESTCKIILDDLGVSYKTSYDLPKLFHNVATELGIASSQQNDRSLRAVFGAVATLVRTLGELRNQVGDSHGRGQSSVPVSEAQANLAVNLAGSLSSFLACAHQAHLNAIRRVDGNGNVILRFDKSVVWRLYDHSKNAPRHRSYYGEKCGACLLLVSDVGVYLMSNGIPKISNYGKIMPYEFNAEINNNNDVNFMSLLAFADGCDLTVDNFDSVLEMKNMLSEDGDFSDPIPIEEFEVALEEARSHIVIVVHENEYSIMSDLEYM